MRKCIVTGDVAAERDAAPMVRFVLDPASVLTPDIAAKLPGRGAWITASREHLATALKRRLFHRAFGEAVTLPDGMDDQAFIDFVANLAARRLLDGVGLSRRAGDVILGGDDIDAYLKGGRKLAVVLSATDASDRGRDGAIRAAAKADAPHYQLFTREALSAAIGLHGVKHIAIKAGRAGERNRTEFQRLSPLLAAPETQKSE